MQTFRITIKTDDIEITQNWYGYGEQSAIAQAFLYYAQNGFRKLEVISIEVV